VVSSARINWQAKHGGKLPSERLLLEAHSNYRSDGFPERRFKDPEAAAACCVYDFGSDVFLEWHNRYLL